MRLRGVWPWAALCLCAFPGLAQERVLTLDEALALARERGAAVALANGRIEEARARREQAGRRFQESPVLEMNGGYRRADRGFLDFEAALTQEIDAGRQRAARLAGTQASVERAEAELLEARRLLVRDAGAAFVRAWVAGRRVAFLARSRAAADELLASTERRFEAGEATALELNRSRIATARARAEQGAAEAEGDTATAHLKALLGLPSGETLILRGDLARQPALEIAGFLESLDRRPDLRALAAEVREAEAEILLGQALARPDWGVRGGIAREERAEIVTAGVVVKLPLHRRGREAITVGQARADALRRSLEAVRAAAETEIRGRFAALARQLAAVHELESAALPALDDNEALARKSFEAGEIDLGELLLLRREILETRLVYLERLLDAALSRVELEAAAGALP